MRDMGLDEAIRAAGGVGALARKIGISQPSISSWPRVPAERVVSVESATGIDRAILRPDLYAQPTGTTRDIDEVDAARAREYALLSVVLARAPDADRRLPPGSRAMRAALASPMRRSRAGRARHRRGAGRARNPSIFIGLGASARPTARVI